MNKTWDLPVIQKKLVNVLMPQTGEVDYKEVLYNFMYLVRMFIQILNETKLVFILKQFVQLNFPNNKDGSNMIEFKQFGSLDLKNLKDDVMSFVVGKF